MCLSCVHGKIECCKYGYKVFKKVKGGWFYPGFHLSAKEIQDIETALEEGQLEAFIVEKWMEDDAEYRIPAAPIMWNLPKGTECNTSYPTGMHVFFKEKDAKRYMKDTPDNFYGELEVKKVKVQKIVASGYQESQGKDGLIRLLKTMVCKKLKIETN